MGPTKDKATAAAGYVHGHGHGHASVEAKSIAGSSGSGHGCDHAHDPDGTCHYGHGHGHGHGTSASNGEPDTSTGLDKDTAELAPAAETMTLTTSAPPILATGFHSGVAAVVASLFEWTEEGACGGDSGDPKLTSCDESTVTPGMFLAGPQVHQAGEIFCFVYKYRQRFAVVVNEIATRLGINTSMAVAKAKRQKMFLDDASCCKATCGAGHTC